MVDKKDNNIQTCSPASRVLEIDFNGRFEFEKEYAILNRDRMNQASTCDVEIVQMECGVPTTRPLHTRVLSNSFAYFEGLFRDKSGTATKTKSSSKRSSGDSRQQIVASLIFTNVRVFEELIHLAYTGRLYVSKSDAYDIFHDCLALDFRYVVELWDALVSHNYHDSRALDFFFLFDRRLPDKSKGWTDTIRYLVDNMNECAIREKLINLPVKKFTPVVRHLSGLVKDERILDLIIGWGDHDLTGRKDSVSELLSNVHGVKNVSGAFAKELTGKLFESSNSKQPISVIAASEKRSLKAFVHMRNGNDYHNFEYQLLKNTGDWCYVDVELVGRIAAFKFVLIQDRVYNLCVRADRRQGARYSTLFRHVPLTRYKSLLRFEPDDIHVSLNASELSVPAFGLPVHVVQMCAVDKIIYVYGMATENSSTNHLDRYIIERDRWLPLTTDDAVKLTAGSMLVSQDQLVYLLGGRPPEGYSPSGYAAAFYDHRVQKWNKLPRTSQMHDSGAACAYDGKIYVAGGRNHLGGKMKIVDRYDPVAGKWEQIASLTQGRDHFTLVPYNCCLWAIGNHNSLSAETYDPETDCWSEYGSSMVRAQGDELFVDMWPSQYRHADNDDAIPAFVLDAIAF